MENRLSPLQDDILKTVYEARETGVQMSEAFCSFAAKGNEFTQALVFLKKEGYIEKNDDYCIATHHLDRSSIITDKGYDYLKTNSLI